MSLRQVRGRKSCMKLPAGAGRLTSEICFYRNIFFRADACCIAPSFADYCSLDSFTLGSLLSLLYCGRFIDSLQHLWCRDHAFGKDELLPLTQTYGDWFDLGLTLVDSLDTLLLLGLDSEYEAVSNFLFSTDLRLLRRISGHALFHVDSCSSQHEPLGSQ